MDEAAGDVTVSVSGGKKDGVVRGVGGEIELIDLVSGEGFKPEDELAVAGGAQRAADDGQGRGRVIGVSDAQGEAVTGCQGVSGGRG